MRCIQTVNFFGYRINVGVCGQYDSVHTREMHKACDRSDSFKSTCLGHEFLPDTPFNQLIRETLDNDTTPPID